MSDITKFLDKPTDLDFRSVRVKNFKVEEILLNRIRQFVENWHYSKNVNGLRISYCFGLFYQRELIGAAIYGCLGMANTWKAYGENERDVLELKRLCCIDKTPKNTESYFIARTIKWIKQNTEVKTIISYADEFYGHQGIIYKASNFEYLGTTSPGRVIHYDGKIFHDKAIRAYQYSNGKKKLKPFAVKLREKLENGEARYIPTPGKHIYRYKLR